MGFIRIFLAFMVLVFCATAAQTAMADCANPVGESGVLVYNPTYKVMQFCDGDKWISMAGGISQNYQTAGVSEWTDVDLSDTSDFDGACEYRMNAGSSGFFYAHTVTPGYILFDASTAQYKFGSVEKGAKDEFWYRNDGAVGTISGSAVGTITGMQKSCSIDATPDAFTFVDVTEAAPNTLVTSNTVTVTGINSEVFIAISGGAGSPEFSIDGGAWVTSGTVTNGQTVQLRLMSGSGFSATRSATIVLGGISDQWDVSTEALDDVPDAYNFTDQTGVAQNTLITSNIITVNGINTGVPVSVSGGGAEISINGGGWVTSGTINNGQTLQVRLTSSASFNATLTATVSLAGVTDVWNVTTLLLDDTPDAFSFTDQSGVLLGTQVTSNIVTVSGINSGVPVSVSGGDAEISINGGGWVTSGTINNGQSLQVRLTASADYGTTISATVNVGGVTDDWVVTTKSDVSYEFGATVLGDNTLTATAVAGTSWSGSDNLAYLAIGKTNSSSSRTFSNFLFDGVASDWEGAAVDNGDSEHISTGMALLNVDISDTEKVIQYNMSGSASKEIAYLRILGGSNDVSVVYSSFVGNGPSWPYSYSIPSLQAGDIVVAALSYRTSSAANAGSSATNMDAVWASGSNRSLDIYAKVVESDGTFSTTLNAPNKYQQWSQGIVVLRRN